MLVSALDPGGQPGELQGRGVAVWAWPRHREEGLRAQSGGFKGLGLSDRVVRAEVVALADLDLDRARQAATRVSEPAQRHRSEQGGACICGRSQFQDPRPAGEVE